MGTFRWLLLMMGAAACAPVMATVDPSPNDTADPNVADTDVVPWLDACPRLVPSDVDLSRGGACSGEPEGELTRDEADGMLYRAFHEAMHLAAAAADGESGLYGPDGEAAELQAFEDHGYARAVAAPVEIDGAPATCFDVRFACWSGGHGGWGYSALDGDALITVTAGDTPVIHIVGTLGLVESGALMGAPTSAVDVQGDGRAGTITGSVGVLDY